MCNLFLEIFATRSWDLGLWVLSHQQQKELPWKTKNENGFMQQLDDGLPLGELPSWTKPSALSLGETKLEIFYHHQGVLLLHLIATIMLIPSLVAFVKVHHPSMCFTLSSLQPWAFDVCFWYPHYLYRFFFGICREQGRSGHGLPSLIQFLPLVSFCMGFNPTPQMQTFL
jgi:hypothetical protein